MGMRIWVMACTFEGVEKEMCDASVSQAGVYQRIVSVGGGVRTEPKLNLVWILHYRTPRSGEKSRRHGRSELMD